MRNILIGYRHPSISLYTPKRNKKKLGLLIAFVIFCFITPMTNFLIPVVGKIISKVNPLWIYN